MKRRSNSGRSWLRGTCLLKGLMLLGPLTTLILSSVEDEKEKKNLALFFGNHYPQFSHITLQTQQEILSYQITHTLISGWFRKHVDMCSPTPVVLASFQTTRYTFQDARSQRNLFLIICTKSFSSRKGCRPYFRSQSTFIV